MVDMPVKVQNLPAQTTPRPVLSMAWLHACKQDVHLGACRTESLASLVKAPKGGHVQRGQHVRVTRICIRARQEQLLQRCQLPFECCQVQGCAPTLQRRDQPQMHRRMCHCTSGFSVYCRKQDQML